MLLWYSSFFKHVTKWCFGTAIAQFFVFLFIFLGVSYLSTLIEIDYTNQVISEYEKFIVLASSLYMVVPFALSNVFLFGILHRNPLILKVFMIGSLINCVVILIVVIGSGIFLAIEGTDYIAYSLIAVGIVLQLFLGHGILLVHGTRQKYLHGPEATSVNSDRNIEET
ncbi:hypothetical protein Zmor_010885 [Zophobas morio]|uniref:Uncharacterized protein n=1 Tax=Zophobas morio TaxID=2755281 RepID=A0AA38MKD2_9CUCU|nr:hypothetical protein Zmor_010885 [Zophobas morio]